MIIFEWLIGLVFIVLLILIYTYYKSRCPKCKKFKAVKQISCIEEGMPSTVTSEEWDEKKYKWVSYTSDAQDYLYTYACQKCGHSWTEKKTKTSSRRRS